jgi:hypothetical protein
MDFTATSASGCLSVEADEVGVGVGLGVGGWGGGIVTIGDFVDSVFTGAASTGFDAVLFPHPVNITHVRRISIRFSFLFMIGLLDLYPKSWTRG